MTEKMSNERAAEILNRRVMELEEYREVGMSPGIELQALNCAVAALRAQPANGGEAVGWRTRGYPEGITAADLRQFADDLTTIGTSAFMAGEKVGKDHAKRVREMCRSTSAHVAILLEDLADKLDHPAPSAPAVASACPHESWEEIGGARKCADCGEWIPAAPTEAAGRELPEVVEEGLAYFERAGDEGDKVYVRRIREFIASLATPPQPAVDGVSEAMVELRELAPRAVELAERLAAQGPKAAHVSASETHELSEWVIAAAAALAAKDNDHD